MRKIIGACCILLLLANIAFAQGIVFEQGNWEEVLAKAKKENKVLFVDIYTSWCGPCKIVAKTVFPQEKVGNYYNQHFINYQLDGEKGDGPTIVKKYGIKGYPTFLYLNGDGEVMYRFSGAKDVKGFLQEAEKVTTCVKFGGWDKMEADYKSGNGNSDLLWAYYELATNQQKGEILNKYLESLPDEKLFTVTVGKIMENDMKLYDYNLMKRMVEGRVKLGKQEEEFNFFFTFGLQRLLTNYLDESIEKGDIKWFEELLTLKKKFNELPQTTDPDIKMIEGRGAFFASEDFLNLRFLRMNGNNDELFRKNFEVYMNKLLKEYPLDTVTNFNKNTVDFMTEKPGMIPLAADQLKEGQKLIASHIIDFTDNYWRIMPSDKKVRERCASWINYTCNLNPYNPDAALKAASLFCRLNYKKDAIQHIRIAIEKQEFFQKESQKLSVYEKTKYEKNLMSLKKCLRDIMNDKI